MGRLKFEPREGQQGPQMMCLLLGDEILEYPACSRQDTISMLYGFAKCMAAMPEGAFDAQGHATNKAILGIVANAISHLESGREPRYRDQ